MASLDVTSKNELWIEFMRELSAAGIEIPVDKNALRTFIDIVDIALDETEVDIVTIEIPAGTGRTWLTNNPSIGRIMMARIEKKRAEVI